MGKGGRPKKVEETEKSTEEELVKEVEKPKEVSRESGAQLVKSPEPRVEAQTSQTSPMITQGGK